MHGEIDKLTDTAIQPKSILAVIPTLNEELHIEECIRSLMNGGEKLLEVPVIVADGGSEDSTCQIVERLSVEFPNIQVLQNPKRLQSAAINLVAEKFGGEETDVIVRCDAHSIYPDRFILDVAESLMNVKADSLVIPMDATGSTCFEKANAWIVDTPLGSGGASHRGGDVSGYVDHGHHAGFKFSTFLELGGYDESFSHNEDAEYDYRLCLNKGTIYMDADIRIKYVPRGSIRSLSRQYYNYGKGRAKNTTKHGQSLRLRQMIPILVLGANIAGLVVGIWCKFFLLAPFGYISLLVAASAWTIFRHRSVCGVWSGLALGAMHMSWALGFLKQKLIG